MRILFIILAIAVSLVSCKTEPKQENNKEQVSYKDALNRMNADTIHIVKALESVTSGSYTYVKLSENGKEFWAAVSAQPIEVGSTYYYIDALEMKNFQSKGLDRVFESIWFVNEFYNEMPSTQASTPVKKPEKKNSEPKNITVDPLKDGYTLADIFKDKNDLKDQIIRVRGEVVKVNPNIMEKNWIHIQDGTSYNGLFDLTITINEEISFKIGDVVTFKGKLILNKDFGSGYKYDFLLENAVTE